MSLANKLKTTSSLLARVKGEVKQVLLLNLTELQPDSNQVRKHFNQNSLKGLAESILNQGLIEPIIVKQKNKDGIYIIEKGERRYRASKIAGLGTIQAIVNDEPNLDEIKLSYQQLAENIQREDLTALEIAYGLQKVKQNNDVTSIEISETLGKSQSWVSQHLNILTAPDYILELIDADIVQDATTINELIKLHEEAPNICLNFCKEKKDNQSVISRAEVKVARGGLKSNKKQKTKRKVTATKDTFRIKIPAETTTKFKSIVKTLQQNQTDFKGINEPALFSLITDGMNEAINGDKTKLEGLLHKLHGIKN